MNNANYQTIGQSVNSQTNETLGKIGQFIVDDTHPSPAGLSFYYVTAITDVAGFSATNLLLHSGSGNYPSDLLAGTELPAGLQDITVTSGSLMCLFS